MKNYLAFLAFIIGIFFTGCKSDHQPLLPAVTGKPGEVLIVIDEYLWESEIGKYLTNLFSTPYEVLPQEEPIYDVIHIPGSGFTSLLKSHRNIILTKISSKNKKPRIIVQRDIWAKPQLVINIIGPRDSTTLNYLDENSKKLISLINQAEIDRVAQNYKKNRVKGIDEVLRKEHNLSISVPMGYSLDLDTADFIWISHELADLSQGVLIYYYDYTDTNTFTLDYLLNKRNEFTKKYVAGPNKGSYMTIEPGLPPIFKEYNKDNMYFSEIRGLWKLENGFMGGPFISISTIDEKRNRVVTCEGFVYAPGLNKRNYMKELEAILQTVKVVD